MPNCVSVHGTRVLLHLQYLCYVKSWHISCTSRTSPQLAFAAPAPAPAPVPAAPPVAVTCSDPACTAPLLHYSTSPLADSTRQGGINRHVAHQPLFFFASHRADGAQLPATRPADSLAVDCRRARMGKRERCEKREMRARCGASSRPRFAAAKSIIPALVSLYPRPALAR